MAQTILSAILEVEPANEEKLRARLSALGSPLRATLAAAVPTLHFMSLTVFKDNLYDPILVLEANFDGPPGPFWAQLEAAMGGDLREMLHLCRARGPTEALFHVVTKTGSTAPIAPLLEAATVLPAAAHQGNRGLDRNRILREAALFAAVQKELDQGIAATLPSAPAVHAALRAALAPQFPWLDQPAPMRIGTVETLLDQVRFWGVVIGLVLLVGFLAAAPGLSLGCLIWGCRTWKVALPVVLSLGAILGGMAIGFRRGEVLDPPLDAPQVNPARLQAMTLAEDNIAQNHMISLVPLKPGAVRALVARASLLFVGLRVRASARNGYLRSMRTIHFAHWALVGNGSRLMFHSNYDGSWESYLDDFIEKAHQGLTAVWTHGVGFPPTRWLLNEGATSGRKFKQWARYTMSESQFWYSAYPDYSVNHIERHARVAQGLRRATLTDPEAATWALDL